jgi:hypothetical protein
LISSYSIKTGLALVALTYIYTEINEIYRNGQELIRATGKHPDTIEALTFGNTPILKSIAKVICEFQHLKELLII